MDREKKIQNFIQSYVGLDFSNKKKKEEGKREAEKWMNIRNDIMY